MQADLNKILDKVNIILVETTHPGNIGATARAMKTMGMSRLRLVRPLKFPGAEATARAAGADDILDAARVFDSLAEAAGDCSLVYATSNRGRNIPWPEIDPGTSAASIIQSARGGAGTGIVFGRESSGLSNEELELCNAVIRIPADERFPSLNLASAVQIICYELRRFVLKEMIEAPPLQEGAPLATSTQMLQLYEHLELCLREINFYNPDRPRLLMRRLKRLCNRLQLDENEYNIIRGILAASQAAARKK